MSEDEWLAFVGEGTRTGKFGVVRKDGRPHVTPIWFLVERGEDGPRLRFNTGAGDLKARCLRRDPRFSLCVDDQAPPYSYVQLNGEAELSDDLTEMLTWATELGARYMGADRAEAFGRRNAVPGELLVTGRITSVVAHADVAD